MDGVRGLPDSTSKGRWLLYLLAITAAVLLILLMAAQTKGAASVTLRRAGPTFAAEGELAATLAQLAAQIEELKALAEKQLEASVQQGQDLSSELAALQQAQQSSSQAIAAELAALKNLTMTRNQQESLAHLQATFEGIYAEHAWGTDGNGSGSGSSLNKTVHTRELLLKRIIDLKARSMIDVPCGGMAWMPLVLEQVERKQPGFRYLGLDIARPVIEANKVTFRNKTNWKFDVKDMTRERLPKGYDLIHCRDALQHLSCPMIVNALHNFALSGAKYLLVGSYDAQPNQNIKSGDYFAINLRLPPFSLSNPDAIASENTPGEENKLQLLYRISELAKKDFDVMRLGCDAL